MEIGLNLLAQAASSGGEGGGLQSLIVSFGPFVLIIVVMYFLLFRSQKKRNQQRQQMLDSIRSGDKVVTSGGVIGTVSSIKEERISLKVAENVKIEVTKNSINGILEQRDQPQKQS